MTPEQTVIEAARNLVGYEESGKTDMPQWVHWDEFFNELKQALETLDRASCALSAPPK